MDRTSKYQGSIAARDYPVTGSRPTPSINGEILEINSDTPLNF